MRKRTSINNGFTLIELMVAVAIIGILMAIVIPNYQEAVSRGHRNDGMDALTAAAQKMEVVRARTGSYTTDLAEANISATSAEGYYINLDILDATEACPITSCYVLQIDGDRGQEQSSVIAYRLHSTGLKERQLSTGDWEPGWK